jgi:hypothetical protein
VAGDFRGWDNHPTYSKAFPRFLDALNRPQQTSKTGSAARRCRNHKLGSGPRQSAQTLSYAVP